MSNTIEDEIVKLGFDNKQFESGVATSIGSLDKLKSSLSFQNAGKGLEDVNRSVGRFNMNPMTSAIEGVNKMWLGMATVAVTAIANITNRVVDAGLKMAKSLTIDPLMAGFQEYGTNLSSTQTIMANTGAKIGIVNKALDELNQYSDKTIYNFSQMAQNIGRFTAAGVEIDDATDAIKGMANTAALTGSTSEQLNSAMYQMSQALASGTIRLMDWNSLVNANMGTENVQKALMATTKSFGDHGAAMDAAIAKNGNFRDSLQEGWLSAETFTKTMKVMAGTTNEAGDTIAFSLKQLQDMGYDLEAAKELNRLSQAAIDSATQVKTMSQAFEVVKESIGSGWAQVFENIFGNLNQSKKLWTGVTESITGNIGAAFDTINGLLVDWQKAGGRDDLLAGFKRAFNNIRRLTVPVRNAFKDIFPPATGQALANFSKGFYEFFRMLRPSRETLRELRDVFGGIFTVFKLGFKVVGFLVGAFGDLFGIVAKGSGSGPGSILEFLAMIGRSITAFGKWVESGDNLGKMLKNITRSVRTFVSGLKSSIPSLGAVGDGIANMAEKGREIAEGLIDGVLEGLSVTNIKEAVVEFANNIVVWIKDALGIHSPATELIPVGVDIVRGIAQGIEDSVNWVVNAMRSLFSAMGSAIKFLFEGLNAEEVVAIINTGLLLAIYIAFKRFFGSFKGLIDSAKGVFDSAGGILDQITSNLKTMQNKVRSEIIRNIAISVALLAVSAILLSTVDGKKLAVSLGAIVGMMTALMAAMGFLAKGSKGLDAKAAAKQTGLMLGMSVAMIAFAAAILILSTAVAIIGQLKMETIKKGLIGVGLILAGLTAATAVMGKTGGGATIFAAASALLIMSVALTAFAGVMKLYEKLDWKTLIRGGGAAAAVIIALGFAMSFFGPQALSGAAGLVLASGALVVMAKALGMFADIGLFDTIKSIVAIALLLTTMVIAANAMIAAMPGAAAMVVMAGAIVVLAKAMAILGKLSLWQLIKGLLAIAAIFTIIGVASIILTPVIPLIAALGGALLLLGAAMFLAGAGMALFAGGLAVLATVGTAGFAVLTAGIMSIVGLLPLIAEEFGLAIVAWAAVIGEKAPLIVGAFDKVWDKMVKTFHENIPALADLLVEMIEHGLRVIRETAPDFVATAWFLLREFIRGWVEHQAEMVDMGIDLVVKLIRGIRRRTDELADEAVKLVVAFIDSLATAIENNDDEIRASASKIGWAIINGIGDGLGAGEGGLFDKIRSLSFGLLGAATSNLKIKSPSRLFADEVGKQIPAGIGMGIEENSRVAVNASEELAKKSLGAMKYAFRNSKAISDGLVDVQPKITPILDLTELERQATQLGSKLGGKHVVDATVSGNRARDISNNERLRTRNLDEVSVNETYNFNQTINSPKAVNHVEAYRGTKSQIAFFKGVKGK